MRRPPRRPPRLDETATYRYPDHLRDSLAGLPAAPGVYIFHGDSEALPLYIGKSVNIRSRVLSHLRTPQEARLLRQARRITCIPTAGEIGALLLEARLIKQWQPLHNKQLRRNRQLCSLQWLGGQVTVVFSRDIDFSREPGLYGLYASRRAALQALRDIADTQRLCLGVLGVERLPPGRPCFRASLRKCAGACHGAESREAHHARLHEALQAVRVMCWPHDGPIGLVERQGDTQQIHVIHNWHYLGSAESITAAQALSQASAAFDADGYRILVDALADEGGEIVPLSV